MLFLIQRVLGAGVKFEFLDPARRFALVVVFEEDASGHEFAAGAAATAIAVSAFISRLQIDKKLSDFMVVVVLHSERPSYLMGECSIVRSDDRNQDFSGRCLDSHSLHTTSFFTAVVFHHDHSPRRGKRKTL
jgi:hypothetical protein